MTSAPPTAPSEDAQRASAKVYRISLAIVGLAVIAAVELYVRTEHMIVIDPSGFSVLAPIYIVAQAIERFLEPIATRLNSTVAQKDALKLARQRLVEAKAKFDAAEKAGTVPADVADKFNEARQAELNVLAALRKVRSERALLLWAVATAFALIITAALGLGLLAAISKAGGFPEKEWVHALDVVLTGAAIGAGTKPLHDLISRIEKAKENADPATKSTPSTPATPAAG